MGSVNLNINIDSIDTTKKIMESEYNELFDKFNNYKTMIESTKDVYDTDSATMYREIGTKYSDMAISYLNNSIKPYIDELDNIKQVYTETRDKLSSSVGGE